MWQALEFANLAGELLWMRQRLVSANLANLDTPGYRAKELDFRSILQSLQEVERLRRTDPRHLGALRQSVTPVLEDRTSARPDGNTVNLELQMARLAETQLLYGSLMELVSRRAALLRQVMEVR